MNQGRGTRQEEISEPQRYLFKEYNLCQMLMTIEQITINREMSSFN